MKVISRGYALALKTQFYYVGPCPRGHDAPRHTHTEQCIVCLPTVKKLKLLRTPLSEADMRDYMDGIQNPKLRLSDFPDKLEGDQDG